MKLVIIALSLFSFPGCTIIGFVIAHNAAFKEMNSDELESGDNIKVYLNNGTEQKGKYVYY